MKAPERKNFDVLEAASQRYRENCIQMELRYDQRTFQVQNEICEDSPIGCWLASLKQRKSFPQVVNRSQPLTVGEEECQFNLHRGQHQGDGHLVSDSIFEELGMDQEEVKRQQQILDDIQRRRTLSEASIHTFGDSCTPELLTEDKVARLKNGKKVLVKGTRHTYESIVQGQATLVQCPFCKTILQIGPTAKMLYCTMCEHLSPIHRVSTRDDADGISIMQVDDHYASAFQRQEVNVPRAA